MRDHFPELYSKVKYFHSYPQLFTHKLIDKLMCNKFYGRPEQVFYQKLKFKLCL